jgi:hypothetical protein
MRESLAEIYSTALRRGGGAEAICFPRMTTRKRENDGYHVTQRVTKQTSSVDRLVLLFNLQLRIISMQQDFNL